MGWKRDRGKVLKKRKKELAPSREVCCEYWSRTWSRFEGRRGEICQEGWSRKTWKWEGRIFVIFEMLRAGESFERANYFFHRVVALRLKRKGKEKD